MTALFKRFGLIVAVLLFCTMTVLPQWAKKPPAEWSKKDVEKMLTDSPWSRMEVTSDATTLFNRGPVGQPSQQTSTGRVPDAVYVKIHVNFFSSKPVRLALARKIELENQGKINDQMAQQLKTFTEGQFQEYVVVTLSVDTTTPGSNVQEALGLLPTLSIATLKNSTFLEVKGGKRVFLADYKPPSGDGFGAKLLFPRMVNGEPFIGPESGDVRVYAPLSDKYTINQRFKVKDMFYDGKLEY